MEEAFSRKKARLKQEFHEKLEKTQQEMEEKVLLPAQNLLRP